MINCHFFDGWIRLPGVEIPWQQRVDTLSVTMMLVVTGVGSLIHLYSVGYMHGDERFSRFFAYLNMFLAFMLTLVTGNNLLMMFVGWEGVGLCSFLLIGFWFDQKNGVGWKNSNAARKAFIVNRIGDFGLLMAIFLTFWTFGTLDFYKPGEIAVVGEHAATAEVQSSETAAAEAAPAEAAAAPAEGEASAHGEATPRFKNRFTPITRTLRPTSLASSGRRSASWKKGATVNFGPFSLPIATVITHHHAVYAARRDR